MREGQRIRLAGQGEASDRGGKSGDLFLRVRLARHPDFSVEGSDLVHEVKIAPWQAVLGDQLIVPTLEGNARLKLPSGTQGGQRFRLRERGLPGVSGQRGDLYVVVQIALPKKLTEREREIWEQLAVARQREIRLNRAMKISLGSDHAGFKLKEKVKVLLGELGHQVKDVGTFAAEPAVDYPLFIRPAAEAVARGECDRGIVFGGSGERRSDGGEQGAWRALRTLLEFGKRATLASTQRRQRALARRTIDRESLALEIVRTWLTTDFEGGRHAARGDAKRDVSNL